MANPQRLRNFPDVPTFAELGFASINLPGWGGILAPAATPAAIVNLLSDEVRRIVALPEVRAKIDEMGFEANATGSAEFAAHLKGDLSRWSAVVTQNAIKLD